MENIWTLQILQLPQNYNTIHINILELILTIQFWISFVFVYHPVVHKCGHLRAPNYRIFSMLHIIYKVSWIPTFLFNDGQLGPSASLLMWSVGCGCRLHNGQFFVNQSGWLNSLNKCHQCPRADLNKKSLPRPKTTAAWKLTPHRSKISKNWNPPHWVPLLT